MSGKERRKEWGRGWRREWEKGIGEGGGSGEGRSGKEGEIGRRGGSVAALGAIHHTMFDFSIGVQQLLSNKKIKIVNEDGMW